ncbi:DoxX family protein [Dyadobacter bucti]|uniref:DoxX family protein n=1 Tax=Dyadobacter bucti TaxID=2572203 RepID=UPI003F6ED257
MKSEQKPSKAMNITLWTAQVILAATFFWAAYMKLAQPAEQLATMWPWTKNNEMLVTLSGIADLLAAIGLILPGMFRMLPQLTIYACTGILALMAAAIIFHVNRGEASQIGINIFLAVLAVFVVWGRSRKAVIERK